MTHNDISGQQAPAPHPSQPVQQKNTIGTVALILAIIGFIFACIPGALIVGWIALPIAFILSLVALFRTGKKGAGIAALIISIIGTIVGFLVFLVVVADAVDEALSDGDTTVSTPGDSTDESDNANDAEEAAPETSDAGTRANPNPLGSTITNDDWSVTIHGVDLDATAKVLAENQFNDEPADGSVYILVDVTATYLGDDAQGETPWVSVDYVTSGGNTISGTDALAVAPDQFDSFQTLYNGASVRGNFVLEIPSEGATEGVLAVSPSILGDTVFIAVS